jgi:hypothetical protein
MVVIRGADIAKPTLIVATNSPSAADTKLVRSRPRSRWPSHLPGGNSESEQGSCRGDREPTTPAYL